MPDADCTAVKQISKKSTIVDTSRIDSILAESNKTVIAETSPSKTFSAPIESSVSATSTSENGLPSSSSAQKTKRKNEKSFVTAVVSVSTSLPTSNQTKPSFSFRNTENSSKSNNVVFSFECLNFLLLDLFLDFVYF